MSHIKHKPTIALLSKMTLFIFIPSKEQLLELTLIDVWMDAKIFHRNEGNE